MEDSELLDRYARERSEDAFRELVSRHVDLVYSAALRQTRDPHRAEDACQLVFATLARKAALLSGHPCLRGWLYTCTHYTAAKLRRSEQRRLLREQEAQAVNPQDDESTTAWENIRPVLDEVMHELGGRDREAVILRYFDRRPLAEVGRALGVSEDAARKRVDRLLERMRVLLARRGITSSAAVLGAALGGHAVQAAPARLVPGLVAATASAGGTGGVVGLMASIKSVALGAGLLGLAALSGILAVGGALYCLNQLRREEAVSTSQMRRIADVRARLGPLGRRAARRKSIDGAAAAAFPAVGTAAGDLDARLADDLELFRWREQKDLADFDLIFAPKMRELGLSPTQIQKAREIVGRLEAEMNDVRETARIEGASVTADPALLAKATGINGRLLASMVDLLGSSNVQTLIRFRNAAGRTDDADALAAQVAGLTFASQNPLGAEQRAKLVELIASHSDSYQSGGSVDLSAVDWDRVMAAAGSALPPVQMRALLALVNNRLVDRIEDQAEAAAKGAR